MRRMLPGTAIAAATLALALLVPGLSRAATLGPHWAIFSTALPTHFNPGDAADEYTLIVMNDGGASTNGSVITIADTLPAELTAVGIKGLDEDLNEPLSCSLGTLTCTFSEKVSAGDFMKITITVAVGAGLPLGGEPTPPNQVRVSGGGAPSASARNPTKISSSPVPFGLSYLQSAITDPGGAAVAQAGSHPFQTITSLAFNTSALQADGSPLMNAEAKDLEVALPPGLVGNPGAVPQCSQAAFQTISSGFNCPADTQVGYMRVFFYSSGTAVQTAPVYNIAPPPGQPAELGFTIAFTIHIPIFFHVRTNGDYGITAQIENVNEGDPVRASILTLWGVPPESAHDMRRYGEPECSGGGCSSEVPQRPFLTLPTSCQATASPSVGAITDSWQSPGARDREGLPASGDSNWVSLSTPVLGTAQSSFTGCERLSFSPTLSAAPDNAQASAPAGYTVDLGIPQNDSPTGLASATLRDASIAMPPGTTLSPGAADGLQACSDEQFAVGSQKAAKCPLASQVGTVQVHTPLLPSPLEGQLYVGQPECGPCSPGDAQGGKMVRLFLQVQGSGVTVKLAGHGAIAQGNGALSATFQNNPQLPFDDLQVKLNGGPRAPLANPAACGPARASADLTPWSSPFTPDASPSSSFAVTGCAAPAPFHPSVSTGTLNNQAGSFGALTLTLRRADGEQDLGQISLRTAPGLLGLLAKVQRCEEPLAAQGACPATSAIGHAIAGVGSGSNPLYVPQAGRPQAQVYLTGPYRGAPFGLAIAVPAQAGPFDLGTVVVRAGIYVDPASAQVTVISDPPPSAVDGVPLHIQALNVTIDREGFIFNPTDCQPLTIAGQLTSSAGASVPFSERFQAANCAQLRFHPRFATSTAGAASAKGRGASLRVSLTAAQGPPSSPTAAAEANIARVDVQLPKALPARLTTLQQACTEAQFAANPAGCPAASFVGSVVARTPVLANPLTGPAILVSHGGAAFPDLVIVLQGEGVVLDLTGNTFIKHSITSSRFDAVPDAPVTSFQLTLPQGRHSALASAKGSLCGKKLTMPTTIVAQNGAVLKQTTKVAVSGCRRGH